MSAHPKVAIIGAGLCGLILAIALHKRGIAYTIYESRSSLTEIGAGINLGPNATQAFELIDPELAREARSLATRNPGDAKETWLSIRVAKGTEGESGFHDGEVLMEAKAHGTGSMFFRRDELLLLLARMAGASEEGRTLFNKKLVRLEQAKPNGSLTSNRDPPVTITFADLTTATADLVIGTDGIHSAVRSCLFSSDPTITNPQYSGTGGYRALIPMHTFLCSPLLAATLGPRSNVLLGKNNYTIMYPIDNGRAMNVGLWTYRHEDPPSASWILKSQSHELARDFADHGAVVTEILRLVRDSNAMAKPTQAAESGGDGVEYWKSYYHAHQPASCFDGRVCIIGDAAYSMPPHLGAGAGQAMEDAFVLAEVLDELFSSLPSEGSRSWQDGEVEAAFAAYEGVRQPRYRRIQEESASAMRIWTGFWQPGLSRDGEQSEVFKQTLRERTGFIWNVDLAAMAREARELLTRELGTV